MKEKLRQQWPKAFLVIACAAFFVQFGLGLYNSIINIFMEGPLGLNGDQVGLVAGIREIPGLLTVVLALSALFLTESILAALCVAALGLGLVLISQVTGFTGLVAATLIYSTGFHLYFPVQSAMVLHVSEPHERAARLGQISAVASLAMLTATVVARVLAPLTGYRFLFMVAGAVAGCSIVIFLLRSRSDAKLEAADISKGFVFKLKYSSYYVLTLLSGSRRHITQTFAIYLLLRVHDVADTTVLNLTLLTTGLSIITKPILGRVVDIIGESRGLAVNYTVVTTLFLCYAFIDNVYLLFAAFLLDQICIGFDVGITTHLSKIVDDGDLKASLAMGSTINHITGVLVPIVGGYLFDRVSPTATFLMGAAICLVSLVQALLLPKSAVEQNQAAA